MTDAELFWHWFGSTLHRVNAESGRMNGLCLRLSDQTGPEYAAARAAQKALDACSVELDRQRETVRIHQRDN